MIAQWVETFLRDLTLNTDGWVILGGTAQLLFFLRFLVQWIASERQGRSVIPVSFWYLSIGGTLGLSVYAIVRADPVFIIAYVFNVFIYVRNLQFIRRDKGAKDQRV